MNKNEVFLIYLQKGTKNALETGRTFATLFADIELRQQLLCVNSHDEFKKLLWEHTKELAEEQSHPERKLSGGEQAIIDEVLVCLMLLHMGSLAFLLRRLLSKITSSASSGVVFIMISQPDGNTGAMVNSEVCQSLKPPKRMKLVSL